VARSTPADALQLDEQLRFQRVLGIVQRVGWGVMALGLIVALAGVFGGGGPLASASASAGALEVTYPRFARRGAPLQLEIAVAAAGPVSLTLGGDFASRLQIERIVPEPARVTSSERGLTFEFAPAAGQRQVIRIDGRTDALGTSTGTLGLGDRLAVRLHSFVYP